MATPTDQERDAFVWMQGRMVQLLLRHDERRFGTTFGEQKADAEQQIARWLQPYRDLAVVFYLRDELFDAILPRIKRRLSFDAPRERMVEEPPARGRVDWGRTAAATWRERPGEIPLEVHTRQRRRHFATPPNLLTVCTLLEYRAAAHTLLDREATHDYIAAFRHPLNEIIDLCTRELAFLQFAGLVHPCQEIIAGYGDASLEGLEFAVRDDLMPGHNPAYEDLLLWRSRFAALRLLDRTVDAKPQPMLGSDPTRDNYLYQLWLFYEWIELFYQRRCILNHDLDKMTVEFWWGKDADRREYRLQHDRGLQHTAGGGKLWQDAPGVRPDFYVERVDREGAEVRDGNTLIWREPGFLLDAKYYKPRDSTLAPSGPVKRMIADLQLTGERDGALLFAFQSAAEERPLAISTTVEDEADFAIQHPSYSVRPVQGTAQYIQPDLDVQIWRVRPEHIIDERAVPPILTDVLDTVHRALRERIEIRCRGIFLDSLTATAHGAIADITMLVARNGKPFADDGLLGDLLLCPKPHVAPWRVDIVSHTRDCCANPILCHIKGQSGVKKPQRLTMLEQIIEAIHVENADEEDETVVRVASERVLAVTKRFAELLQPDIASYRVWIRDQLQVEDLFDVTPLLTDAQRETLALGRFLWEQIDYIKATNYAAPVLLFTGVLEELLRTTIWQATGKLYDPSGRELQDTLGTLGHVLNKDPQNWSIVEQKVFAGGFWDERVSLDQSFSLVKCITMVRAMGFIRNDAAHRAKVEQKAFKKLVTSYFGSSMTGVGVMNGLLLAWRIAPD